MRDRPNDARTRERGYARGATACASGSAEAEKVRATYVETHRRLSRLKLQGKPISIVVYPEVEHGWCGFEVVGGQRLSTRQPASLLALLAGFARSGRVDLSDTGDDLLP